MTVAREDTYIESDPRVMSEHPQEMLGWILDSFNFLHGNMGCEV